MNARGVPTFSITILNWNSRALLEQCLAALAAQTCRSFELIVVDNGSKDDSAAWLARTDVAALVAAPAKVIMLDHNTGFAAGMNTGMRASAGQWLMPLNVDVFLAPDFLEQAITAVRRHPEAAMLGARVLRHLNGPTDDVICTGVWLASHLSIVTQLDDAGDERAVFGPAGCCPLFRRDALEAARLEPAWTHGSMPEFYDEQYFAYGEDVDLYLRLQLLGFGCVYVPAMTCWHVHSGTQDGIRWHEKDAATIRRVAANVQCTWLKNCPAKMLALLAPRVLLAPFAMCAALLVRAPGKCLAPIAAVMDALQRLPRTLRIRRALQARRVRGADELINFIHHRGSRQ